MSVVVLIGIMCFWLFSPEALTLIGNGAGLGSTAFTLMLVFSASLVAAGILLPGRGCHLDSMAGDSPLAGWPGVSYVLGFSAISGTALFASTGMLVSAGFTFNEVFFYRFPNFSFSSLLLFLVVVLHQLPARMAAFLQGALVLLTMCCLVVLVVAGIIGNPSEPAASRAGAVAPLSSLLPLLLVFAGFEQSFLRRGTKVFSSRVLLCFLGAVTVLICWGIVSAKFAAGERLVSSSIPYMQAASGILGQKGRMVMGIAVISGSCAAVNGLFGLSSSYLARVAGDGWNGFIIRGMPLILALAVGGLWLMGVAGSRNLELYIRASLLLWLLYGGVMLVAGERSADRHALMKNAPARIVGCLLILSSVLMAWFYGHYRAMGLFFVGLLTGTTLCIMVVSLMHGRNASERR